MKMQIADVRVTLGGEIESMRVEKKAISVAEAMVLNAIHGANAVHNFRNIRLAEVSAVSHKRYLSERYQTRTSDNSKLDVANAMFPGLAPQFPETFEEAGLLEQQAETAEIVDLGGTGIHELDTGVVDPADSQADDSGEGDSGDVGGGKPLTPAAEATAAQRAAAREARKSAGAAGLAAAMG